MKSRKFLNVKSELNGEILSIRMDKIITVESVDLSGGIANIVVEGAPHKYRVNIEGENYFDLLDVIAFECDTRCESTKKTVKKGRKK